MVPAGLETFMQLKKRSVVNGQSQQTNRRAMGLAQAENGSPAKTLREVRASVEREIILAALGRHGWKIAATATELNISRSTIYKQMTELGLRKPSPSPKNGKTLKEALEDAERGVVMAALEGHRWMIAPAARALEIPRQSLYNLMKTLGIQKPAKEMQG